MPHKRAKRSVREVEMGRRGSDLAPSPSSLREDISGISKRAAWVLGAEKVRNEWREKKRMRDGDVNDGPSKRRKKALRSKNDGTDGTLPRKIMPGETLGQFNRRIEDELRPGLRAAIKSSSSVAKQTRVVDEAKSKQRPDKTIVTDGSQAPVNVASTSRQSETTSSLSTTTPKRRMTKTEFDTRPKITRLNDVALAPPTLEKATRKAPERNIASTGVLSIEQKQEMDTERERVIRRYRELKEAKRFEYEGQKSVSVKRKRTDDGGED